MNDKDLFLFIDETGLPTLKVNTPYILCGCSILKEKRDQLKIKADQIKFKYWGKTNINFHSVEIAKDQGNFKIFQKNPQLKKAFIKDLNTLLNQAPIFINCILIDKKQALSRGWIQNNKIIYETAENLIKNFIIMTHVRGNVTGRIVIESSTEKDPQYLKVFNKFLSNGIPILRLSNKDVKKCITSISFVTKQNNDIETQITDLISYGAKCKFKFLNEGIIPLKGSYEAEIMNILDKKLFSMPSTLSSSKKKMLKLIESFLVLPR